MQLILSFLDAKSLARCETAWPSFLAAADAGQADQLAHIRLKAPVCTLHSRQTWSHLLLLDFGFQSEEKWRESYRRHAQKLDTSERPVLIALRRGELAFASSKQSVEGLVCSMARIASVFAICVSLCIASEASGTLTRPSVRTSETKHLWPETLQVPVGAWARDGTEGRACSKCTGATPRAKGRPSASCLDNVPNRMPRIPGMQLVPGQKDTTRV